ncbi:CBS domain-containing protein [Paraburkholderia hospita]|uniref:CBS domain-containing protein n=1 Tax=Paraburkholderia hospita TaxID=169430 RepID=UPI0013F16472
MKDPVCVQAEETLDAAARTFKKENVGALPVCRDSKVIGMITRSRCDDAWRRRRTRCHANDGA